MKKKSKYSSHLYVLKRIPKLLDIKRVIEFGCGEFSTKIFLKYPAIQNLYSLESDTKWYHDFLKELKDERLTRILSPEDELIEIAKTLGRVDLVFVDGKAEHYRGPTMLAAKEMTDLVVAHDAENKNYLPFINSFKYVWIYKKEKPYTAILSDVINTIQIGERI